MSERVRARTGGSNGKQVQEVIGDQNRGGCVREWRQLFGLAGEDQLAQVVGILLCRVAEVAQMGQSRQLIAGIGSLRERMNMNMV